MYSHRHTICGPAVRSGCRIEKKGKDRTGQDSQTKKLYFASLGRSPHCTDWNQNLHDGSSRRHNHVCKVSRWYFQVLRFYSGSNFPFSYWFLHGPYNSSALLRCLWWIVVKEYHRFFAFFILKSQIDTEIVKFMFKTLASKTHSVNYSNSKHGPRNTLNDTNRSS